MRQIGELDDCLQWGKSPLLETVAIFFYQFLFFSSIFASIALFVYVIFDPFFRYLAIPYAIWYIYDWHADERGSHLWPTTRHFWLWKYMASYFQHRLVKTAELPADRNYIIGSHPHGIMNIGTVLAFATETCKFGQLFPGLTAYGATLPIQFLFPIRREYLLLNGFISSSQKAIGAILGKPTTGNVVVLSPGGAEEALEAHADLYNVILTKRKGFIRIALKYGADLVPCYHFGEQKIYRQSPNPEGSQLRAWQRRVKGLTGATPPLFWGRCPFDYFPMGWMPLRRRITSVVGAPIRVDRTLSPSDAQVDELHANYCTALKALFDEYKLIFDDDATTETRLSLI